MTDVTASPLANALRDRYVLERELGRGGMATVYLARDLKHDRPVALKVLRPELAASLGPERFQREIRFAARLQHPHILSVHDSGEAAGQLWFTMPYVEGESLRTRLTREGQLPIEAALRITSEAAQALQYAHEHGVIHRDIKPENLLLTTDGNTLVADFGIARALGGTGGPEERLTETGLSLGTPRYMSPEQASADRALDARTDVYSLGCVLYEMLAGEPPFTGPTPQAVIAKRLTEPVPHLRSVRDVPVALERVVTRALARAPADRFATAAEFAEALAASTTAPTVVVTRPKRRMFARRILIPLALAAVTVAGVTSYRLLGGGRFRPTRPRIDSIQRLAVLPFENLGRPEDEYFADGLTDELTSRLASVSGVGIISRASAMHYKNAAKPLRQIGKELGVDYVLEGSVRWERLPDGGSRVRVTPELVSAADDRHLWSERYDADLADIFRVQAEIAAKVVSALGATLHQSEGGTAARSTTNLKAYEYYLRGRSYLSRGRRRADVQPAVQMFEQAVDLDPQFAVAYASLASAYLAQFWWYYDRTQARLAKAKAAADRALQLDPELPEGHVALGMYHYYGELDYDRALAEFFGAQRGRSQDVEVLSGIAAVKRRQGRWDEALRGFEQIEQLDPRSARWGLELGNTYFFLRRYAEAVQALDRGLRLNPGSLELLSVKSLVLLASDGSTARARQLFEGVSPAADLRELAGPPSVPVAARWAVLGLLSDSQQARLRAMPLDSVTTDSAAFYLWRAALLSLRHERQNERPYYDSAARVLEWHTQDLPGDWNFHSRLGLAYAGQKRFAEALREAETGVEILPWSKDVLFAGNALWILAGIEVEAGRYDRALEHLRDLLSHPGYVSPGWLRVDPAFAPLRSNPRFERLLQADR